MSCAGCCPFNGESMHTYCAMQASCQELVGFKLKKKEYGVKASDNGPQPLAATADGLMPAKVDQSHI